MTSSKFLDLASFVILEGTKIPKKQNYYLSFSKNELNYTIFCKNILKKYGNIEILIHMDGKLQELHKGHWNGSLEYTGIFNKSDKKLEWFVKNEKRERYDELIKKIPRMYLEYKNKN